MSQISFETRIEYFTTDDGLRLAYDDAGEGVPLICLAGLTRNMNDFNFVRPHLLRRCRVIRLDYRGRGKSDFDSDYSNYNILRETRDTIALMDRLGLDQAAILGTSRGGLIAMALAGGHKDRLLGVCLNDIGAMIEAEGLAFIFSYLGVAPKFQDYDEAAIGMKESHERRFPGVSHARWRDQARNVWLSDADGLHLSYDAKLRRIFLEQSASDAAPDLWMLFEELKGLPIGLLRGENSDILSAETAQEMLRRRPDMLYAEVKRRGHVPFLDEPEALELLDNFLDLLEAPAPRVIPAAVKV